MIRLQTVGRGQIEDRTILNIEEIVSENRGKKGIVWGLLAGLLVTSWRHGEIWRIDLNTG